MLLVTAAILTLAGLIKGGANPVTFRNAFIIGIAQAIAVIPGISRSGATISTGLLLKTGKDETARFSFLMVLIPVLGAAFLDFTGSEFTSAGKVETMPLIAGFSAAFISGLLACSWMIKIVKKGKLIYFAIYCFIIGLIAIFASCFNSELIF